MIGNALGRDQKSRSKDVRTLLCELGCILAARRRDRLTAVEQRMGVFVCVGEPTPDSPVDPGSAAAGAGGEHKGLCGDQRHTHDARP
jgi:hypothetical protein